MSDLINRQDAIEALRVAYFDKDIQSAKGDPCIVDAMTDWAIRQVKELPSAEPCDNCIHDDEDWDSEACDGCFYLDRNGTTCEFCARYYPDRFSARMVSE